MFKYFEKINGNYLSFAYCQIKSHFFLIPFLIFLKRATARTAWHHRDSLYIITQTISLCQLFFNTFLKFFENFSFFSKLRSDKAMFSRRPRDSLTIISLSYIPCQLFCNTFFNFFEKFTKIFLVRRFCQRKRYFFTIDVYFFGDVHVFACACFYGNRQNVRSKVPCRQNFR